MTKLPIEKQAYRPREAALAFGISRSKIYVLIREGTLRSARIGGSRLIARDALEALISGGTK